MMPASGADPIRFRMLASRHAFAWVLALQAACLSPERTSAPADATAHTPHGAAAHSSASTRPVELLSGLGDLSHRITTSSGEAQRHFDQGLALLYGFNHDEAARSFRRAAELDPEAAMPWWGLALAIGPNYNDTAVDAARAQATWDAVQAAKARAAKASPREQDYVRALAKRYASPDPASDWLAFHLDYSDAMRELVHAHPDDLDAATLFAESLMMLRPWQLWTAAGEPAPGTLELVSVLENVLRRNPDHTGANHFYIHAVEASKNLERALPSASRLMNLAPAAGHLVHMPGHIYLQTGDYELAAKTNVAAADADRRFVERTGATGMYPLMYWTHNIHFVAYARIQQGRYEDALAAAREMVRNVGDAPTSMQMLEGFTTYPLAVMLAFRDAEAILAEPEPPAEWAVARAFWRSARGVAYADRGEVARAEEERALFGRAVAAVPEEDRFLINNTAADYLAVAGAVLDAELAEAKGAAGNGGADIVTLWQAAAERQASLQYDEPPPWYEPIALRHGGALLRAGRSGEAEAIFRRALESRPRDGRLLYGLWQSLVAAAPSSDADLVQHRYEAAWISSARPLRIDDL